MNANEILKLSSIATERLRKMIVSKVTNDNNPIKQIVPRANYIEYYFNDGTMLELAVVRDFNDNMNPVSVVLNHYYECNNFYTRLYTERFQVSWKKLKFFWIKPAA